MGTTFDRLAMPLPDGTWGFPLTFANGTDDIIVAILASTRTMKRFSVPALAELESFTLPLGTITNANSCKTLASDGAGTIWYILFSGFFGSTGGAILFRRDPNGTVTQLRAFTGAANWLFGTNVVYNHFDDKLYAVRRFNTTTDTVEIHQIDPTTGASVALSTSASGFFGDPSVISSDGAIWFPSYGNFPAVHRYDIATGDYHTLAVAGYSQNLVPLHDGTLLTDWPGTPNLQQLSFDGTTIVVTPYTAAPEFQFYDAPDDIYDRRLAKVTTSADFRTSLVTTKPGAIDEAWLLEAGPDPLDVPTLAVPGLAVPFRQLGRRQVGKELR